MVQIYFLKNSVDVSFESTLNWSDVIKKHFPSVVKKSIAVRINDCFFDLSEMMVDSQKVHIVTYDSDDGLDIIRHDASHILAKAVKSVFGNVKLGVGPSIRNGFFYDFCCDKSFSLDDFSLIEKKMTEIIEAKEPFEKISLTRDDAINSFLSTGEKFKVEIIKNLPEDSVITAYKNGDFIDLCKGPHSPHTGYVKAFKLTSLSGAYWKGDSNNDMLQRIYGTAWDSPKALRSHLLFLEEVKKRDHRKIAKDMDLFHIQEEAAGQVFWHESGWILYRLIEEYIRKKIKEQGYVEVKTPALLNKSFWEKSGHWSKFKEDMFVVGEDRALKPMNCPCHIQIFNIGNRSYKDLPIRMAEFGSCYRNESSGSLYGLMRVRNFVQDDAHIFCTDEQVVSETMAFVNLLFDVYKDFGFTDILIKFSDRPKVKAGDEEVWDKAEGALLDAINFIGLDYKVNKGEGAFYGPKLEFVLKDAIGREWQCGTLQVDFVLPERLNANYVNSEGNKTKPVILHRAIIGTFERFIGILLEHTCGRLPLWLSPIQVVVLPIDDTVKDYAKEVFKLLLSFNIRVNIDFTNEKISYKIRSHSLKKIPVLWVIGSKEELNRSISERRLGSNSVSVFALEEALDNLIKLCSL